MAPLKDGPGWFYVLDTDLPVDPDDSDLKIYKIGRGANLDSRLKQVALQLPYKVRVAYAAHVPAYKEWEGWLHKTFKAQRMNGEWFRLDYDQLGLIAEWVNYEGWYENSTGEIVRDPFRPFTAEYNAILARAEAELEADHDLAVHCKYWPYNHRSQIEDAELLEEVAESMEDEQEPEPDPGEEPQDDFDGEEEADPEEEFAY